MITIDFQVDESVLAEELEDDVTIKDYVFFVSTIFIMPVKFKIDNIEFFDFNNSSAPIMSLANEGLITIKDLKYTKKETYDIIEGPGEFEFTLLNPIHVKVDFYDGSERIIAITKYDELLEAFQKYADKVRKFMWERVPQLNEHPHWGPWLRGERD